MPCGFNARLIPRVRAMIFLFPSKVFEEGFGIVTKLRNNDELRGLNFGKREPDAQNEFHSHARAESHDLRDRRGPGVVAENPSALPLR
jgi:hypothetical protein